MQKLTRKRNPHMRGKNIQSVIVLVKPESKPGTQLFPVEKGSLCNLFSLSK